MNKYGDGVKDSRSVLAVFTITGISCFNFFRLSKLFYRWSAFTKKAILFEVLSSHVGLHKCWAKSGPIKQMYIPTAPGRRSYYLEDYHTENKCGDAWRRTRRVIPTLSGPCLEIEILVA